MPRYEFSDNKSQKFWEITLSGNEVTARWGRIGTDGQTKTKSFEDETAASKDYEKQIAGKVKKGYALAEGGDDGAAAAPTTQGVSNPELEAVIRAAPDDSDGYLVYGDWLQSEGEVLGELVPIQHALAAKPGDKSLRDLEQTLLTGNSEYFFGAEHPDSDGGPAFEDIPQWQRPATWSETAGWKYGHSNSIWRNGFMHSLIFSTGYYGDDEDSCKPEAAGAILGKMLALLGSRFVQRISIGEIWADYDDGEGPDTTFAIDAIAKSPCASMLKEFEVTGGDHDLNGVTLDASALWKACPNLEVVVLYAGQLTIGTIDAPNVKRFAAQTGGLEAVEVKAIAEAKWPKLEDLEIWFGDEQYGCNCSYSDVEPVLGRTDLALKRLGIMNMVFGDEVCAGLVHSPLLPGLEHLDLTKGVIGEDGARSILDNKEKFAHLKTFHIAGYWSDEIAAELKAIGVTASVETRGPADYDYRYVEVGE
tara:strand:- start:32541 stop:33968 length:1428 start_codon:yes stop_codon:yes gene_type:complete